jgi:hypothetical protein
LSKPELNWRIGPPIKDTDIPTVEFQLDSGEWVYPDCAYYCDHCEACLGCLRKMWNFGPFEEWEDDEQLSDFWCARSADGLHHCRDDGDDMDDKEIMDAYLGREN